MADASTLSKPLVIVSWVLQIAVVAILAMAMIPKFTGDEGSKAMFDILGVEPLGRYAAGLLELTAIVLLLIPKTIPFGAIAATLAMLGALAAHLTKLGISIDAAKLETPALEAVNGPSLFIMALFVLASSLAVLFIRRGSLPFIGAKSES